MKIKVDYEECKICDNNQSCILLDNMKALVAATVENLRIMAHVDDKGTAHPNDIQS